MLQTLPDFYNNPKLKALVLKDSKKPEESIGRTPAGVPIYEPGVVKVPPPEIFAIEQIEELKFDYCHNLDIAATFSALTGFPNLVRLEFKNCKIREIPPEIGVLQNLTHLSFSVDAYRFAFNSFDDFPPEFGNLVKLQELDLCDNRDFKRFPADASKLRSLRYINFRGLPSLPENTGLIPNLRHLRLYKSNITPAQIEPLVAKPNGLEWVTVNDYYFKSFGEISKNHPNFKVIPEDDGSTMRGSYL